MAVKTKTPPAEKTKKDESGVDSMTQELISALNKEFGLRVAYNLSTDEAPTNVNRWIDTGSVQLNYAIRNAPGGGYPEGRIIEIAGPPSIGKSHLAYAAAAATQRMGGLVVYIDTENATPISKLKQVGIDIAKSFVYCDTHCTEEVFTIIESTITKAKQILSKNIPILVIWDSVAASSPKAELEGDYDQNTVGLQARVISKGMRKITGVIGHNNVTLLCLNQLRSAIGVLHGDPDVTPGGRSIPFHASLRIKLSSGTQVKDKQGNVIGIHVITTIKKNKVERPFRKCEFDIIFGKGIVEQEYLFDECRSYCESNKVTTEYTDKHGKKVPAELKLSGTGAWKELNVSDKETGEVLVTKKFYKHEFDGILNDEVYRPFILKIIDDALIVKADTGGDHGESPESDEGEI